MSREAISQNENHQPDNAEATSDEELARRACGGSRQAIEALFVRHHLSLRAMVARSVYDPEDVHDIVQEAFMDVVKGLHSWDDSRPFLPWMRVICRNRMFRFLKRKPKSGMPLQQAELAVFDDDMSENAVSENVSESVEKLQECLQRLSAKQRQILFDRYHRGLSYVMLGEEIGKSANATSVFVHRLRKKLLNCLAHKGIARLPL